jgi:hypothetical protein
VADRTGRPIAAEDLKLDFFSGSSNDPSLGTLEVRTDATGRFRIPYDARTRPPSRLSITRRGAGRHGSISSRPIVVPEADEKGTTEVGAVLLDEAPLWLQGRVVDEAGAPLAAEVDVDVGQQGERATWDDRPYDRTMRPQAEIHARGWNVRCNAQGEWFLHGPPTPTLVTLRARHEGYSAAEVSFDARASSSSSTPTIVLRRQLTVHGRLRIDRGLPRSLFHVTASGTAVPPDTDTERSRVDWLDAAPLPECPFELPELLPGSLRLAVRVRGRAEPLLVETIELRSPPREDAHVFLPEWNLEGRVPVVRLAVDAGDSTDDWRSPLLHWRCSPSDSWEHAEGSLRDGFVVPNEARPFEAVLWVPRRRVVHLQDVTTDRKVVVPRGVRVRVTVVFDDPLPDGVNVGIGLEPVLAGDDGRSEHRDVEPWNERDWRVVPSSTSQELFELPFAGPYRVEIGVYPEGAGFPAAIELDDPRIEVVDALTEQAVEIRVTAEQLQRAIRRKR